MRAVIIGKDVAIGDGARGLNVSTITSLTDGALSVYTAMGIKVNTPTLLGTTHATEPVTMHVGGTPIVGSSSIDREYVKYKYLAYKAPTNKTMNIGADAATGSTYALNLPDPYETGMELGLHIIDVENIKKSNHHKEYISVVGSGTSTYQLLLTELIAKVNATSKLVTAVANAATVTGIKFTGKTVGVGYQIVPAGILEDADITEYQLVNGVFTAGYTTHATPVGFGSGTGLQVLELEVMGNAEDGRQDTYSATQKIWSEASKVDLAATYDLHVVEWRDERRGTTSMKTDYENHLIIAVPAGAVSTAVKALLEVL